MKRNKDLILKIQTSRGHNKIKTTVFETKTLFTYVILLHMKYKQHCRETFRSYCMKLKHHVINSV